MMTPDKKIRSLVFIIAFLFITNIILLLFLLFSRNIGHRPPVSSLNTVGSFLKDSMGFDKKQMEAYQNWRKIDFEKGKQAFEGLKSAKNKFYENIYTDNLADSAVNNLALIIGAKQTDVDKHMLQHFRNLRSICTPQQLPRFDSLFKTIVEKVTLGKVRRH